MKFKTLITAAAFAASSIAFAQTQGVTDKEIVLGIITDLSGPIALYGKEARNAFQMKADEINAAGGIHGRKIRLVVEDNGYDPKRALLAAQKLVTRDKVFAILGHLGTATNMAALPILIENKVYNFLPQGASKDLYEPPSPYKIGLAPSYSSMASASLAYLLTKKSYKRIGILYQDDEMGQDVLLGMERQLKSANQSLVEKASYKRGATDFSSQIAKLKAADCDLVLLGTTLREAVGAVAEARKLGFNPEFLASVASYSTQVPALGGKAMDGMYGATFIQIPYPDDPNAAVRNYYAAYKKRYNEEPGLYSMYSNYTLDVFAKVAHKAGKNLNHDTFNAAVESTKLGSDALGNPGFSVTKDDRLAIRKIRVVQIVDGKWRSVSDLLDTVPAK